MCIGRCSHGPGMVEHDFSEIAGHVEALIDMGLIAARRWKASPSPIRRDRVAWDRGTKQPLADAIVWQDQRTQAQLDAFDDTERAIITDRAACRSMPISRPRNWPGCSRTARPSRQQGRQERSASAPSDAFLIDRLTGEYATDAATASRTSLMNLAGCIGMACLPPLFRVPEALLPDIRSLDGPFGTVRRKGGACLAGQRRRSAGGALRPWLPPAGRGEDHLWHGDFALALSGDTPAMDRPGLVPTLAWRFGAEAPVYALDAGDYTAASGRSIGAIRTGIAPDLAAFDLSDGPSALEAGSFSCPRLPGLPHPTGIAMRQVRFWASGRERRRI